MNDLADQLLRDVQGIMDGLGRSMLCFIDTNHDSGEDIVQEVSALAREVGDERINPDAQAYTSERARIALAIVVLEDIQEAPWRGQRVLLFDEEWQIRSVKKLGLLQGQVLRLTLAASEISRGV